MKLKHIAPILFISLFMSCSNDDDSGSLPVNEVEGLKKVKEITKDAHTVELYTKSGKFNTGYNNISIRIKDNKNSTYIENAIINWTPMMKMATMEHSGPKSDIRKATDKKTVYSGFVIFQMTGTDGMGWSLNIAYTIDNELFEVKEAINVTQSSKQNVTTVTGSDGVKYILALIEPVTPKIAVNEIIIGLYKMESMMLFPPVENYTIALDPRMPAMSNHSSTNNQNLVYTKEKQMYDGKLSLTMSGHWILNLKLLNDKNETLKGEDVTDTTTKSSLFLELEF